MRDWWRDAEPHSSRYRETNLPSIHVCMALLNTRCLTHDLSGFLLLDCRQSLSPIAIWHASLSSIASASSFLSHELSSLSLQPLHSCGFYTAKLIVHSLKGNGLNSMCATEFTRLKPFFLLAGILRLGSCVRGDVLIWLVRILLTSRFINQRWVGHNVFAPHYSPPYRSFQVVVF